MENRNLIIETQYFPSISWMVCGSLDGRLNIDSSENYNKRSLRNKTLLSREKEPIILTVPLVRGKHGGQNITEVKISYDAEWTSDHVNAIKFVYGKSPYFIHYSDSIINLIKSGEKRLFLFNNQIIELIIDLFDLDITIEYQKEFHKSSFNNFTILRDQCRYTGDFSDVEKLIQYELECLANQTHLPFIPSPRSSVLDLLFYLGPETRLYLNHAANALNKVGVIKWGKN